MLFIHGWVLEVRSVELELTLHLILFSLIKLFRVVDLYAFNSLQILRNGFIKFH